MKKHSRLWFVLALPFALVASDAAGPCPLSAQEFDLLIENGQVIDGSGNPGMRADVGIQGDRIVAVGDLSGRSAQRIIDAAGLVVVPGFVDLHSHSDVALVAEGVEPRRAHNLVAQGITTVVGGPDGRNAIWPISDEAEAIRSLGVGVNFVPMVGHSTVRGLVMGEDYEREATPAEIQRMRELVREGMEAGAWGLGAGPEYRPARFSSTEEIIELARVVADYDGFYFSHQRSQSPLTLSQVPSMVDRMPVTGSDGMEETIRIGRETGIRVVGSHIKAKGVDMWGQASKDVIRIDRAREEGVQVFLDQYSYETFGGGGHRILPPWAFAEPGTDYSGGLDDPKWREPGIFRSFRENLRRNLDDPELGPVLVNDIEYLIRIQGGADRLIIVDAPSDADLVGRTLAQVAQDWGVTPVEGLARFAMEAGTPQSPHGVLFRAVAGHDFDVKTYMSQPYTATSTDAGVAMQVRPGLHPRYFGSFVRKIAHYVKSEGTVSLPFAVRSSTNLPAQIIGLPDRGLIRPGFHADVVVFDYDRLEDRATIMEPGRYPDGIMYVLVNGGFTVDQGELTGALPGRVLDRAELRPKSPGVSQEGSR
jgi:N-acyl-D-amino-acid deacylase